MNLKEKGSDFLPLCKKDISLLYSNTQIDCRQKVHAEAEIIRQDVLTNDADPFMDSFNTKFAFILKRTCDNERVQFRLILLCYVMLLPKNILILFCVSVAHAGPVCLYQSRRCV